MPIYEYECEKCKTVFEAMQSISAKPLKKCAKSNCKGKVHRLVSASGFIFKGSGWFTSEYPSDARKKGWESESQNSTAPNSKEAEPSEKKPTAKTAVSDEKTTAKPAPKKSTQKNPYSEGKKPSSKTST
jgi:putative FmdB family regulatory protein